MSATLAHRRPRSYPLDPLREVRHLKEAGVRYRKPHETRHTFASTCYARGMTDKEVQRLLGHKDSRTTLDTYVHVRDETVSERFRELVGAT